MMKSLPAVQETWIQSPGWEDLLEGQFGNPLQYPCLGNPMDRGAWWLQSMGFIELDTTEQLIHTHCVPLPV